MMSLWCASEKKKKKKGICVTSWLHVTHGAAASAVDAGWRILTPVPQSPAQTPLSLFWMVHFFFSFFFFSSTAKPAIFCSFSMPSLAACLNHTHSYTSSTLKYALSEVLCAVLTAANAQGFMLYFSGEEIPPISRLWGLLFSLRLKSAFMICLLLRKHIQRVVFEVHFCCNSGVMWAFAASTLVIKFWFISKV